MKRSSLFDLVLMGLFIAFCYVAFMFLKIPVPGTNAYVHFGNAICLLAALILGGWRGGLCGALGMGIADITTAGGLPYLPSTLVLKFAFGLLCGVLFALLVKKHKPWFSAFIACAAAMLFNFVAAPLANFLTNAYIIGAATDAAAITAAWSSVPSAINAVVSTIAAPAIFVAITPALRKYRAR